MSFATIKPVKCSNYMEQVFTICVFASFLLENIHAARNTLIMVHVLFRHGDRTPNNNTNVYPNDPYINDNFFPYGRGQLTNKGKLTSYNMGKELRARYNDFLGDMWTQDILFAQSTDVMRTKMSLDLVLAGLFPPTRPKWLAEMKWQPIPYINLPIHNDPVLFGVACPNYRKIRNEYYQSPAFISLQDRFPEFAAYLSKHAGANYTSAGDVSNLHHLLVQQEECGRVLPKWTHSVYPEPIRSIAIENFEEMNATPQLTRFMSGGLLEKIINDTLFGINNTDAVKAKMFLYSAHDITVASFLINLGVYERHLPVYGCYVALEVHKIRNVYGIKVFYQDYTKTKPRLLTIPGCNRFCPLDEFLRLTAKGVLEKEDKCVS